ncbi:MAG: PEP-CTERM sorting domain-containing protein [Deltaproteobacteria bacterium]|nr:MAG: PEP-CTERM sorting domain-containing protein [Deltaproteobacteria bacterium]
MEQRSGRDRNRGVIRRTGARHHVHPARRPRRRRHRQHRLRDLERRHHGGRNEQRAARFRGIPLDAAHEHGHARRPGRRKQRERRNGSVIAGYGTGTSGSEASTWTGPLYAPPTGLGTLGGANPVSAANGVSANGSVVVGRTTTAAGTEAFMWTSGGGMVSIGDFPDGGTNSTANAISDDGSVIVGGGLHSGPSGEAFRWTSGTGLVGLGDLAGGNADSLALGVSGDGNAVVGQSDSGNGIEAFIWTIGSGIQPLGDLAGGGFESGTAADGSHAVLWSSGALFDLNVIAAAVLPAGWQLEDAFSISADGLSIVGRANNPDGNNEAFLLRLDSAPIPEPGTGLLVSFGLLVLAARRCR